MQWNNYAQSVNSFQFHIIKVCVFEYLSTSDEYLSYF